MEDPEDFEEEWQIAEENSALNLASLAREFSIIHDFAANEIMEDRFKRMFIQRRKVLRDIKSGKEKWVQEYGTVDMYAGKKIDADTLDHLNQLYFLMVDLNTDAPKLFEFLDDSIKDGLQGLKDLRFTDESLLKRIQAWGFICEQTGQAVPYSVYNIVSIKLIKAIKAALIQNNMIGREDDIFTRIDLKDAVDTDYIKKFLSSARNIFHSSPDGRNERDKMHAIASLLPYLDLFEDHEFGDPSAAAGCMPILSDPTGLIHRINHFYEEGDMAIKEDSIVTEIMLMKFFADANINMRILLGESSQSSYIKRASLNLPFSYIAEDLAIILNERGFCAREGFLEFINDAHDIGFNIHGSLLLNAADYFVLLDNIAPIQDVFDAVVQIRNQKRIIKEKLFRQLQGQEKRGEHPRLYALNLSGEMYDLHSQTQSFFDATENSPSYDTGTEGKILAEIAVQEHFRNKRMTALGCGSGLKELKFYTDIIDGGDSPGTSMILTDRSQVMVNHAITKAKKIDLKRRAAGREGLDVTGQQCNFQKYDDLEGIISSSAGNMIILLGGTLGNFEPSEQRKILDNIYRAMYTDDLLILGLKLMAIKYGKKDHISGLPRVYCFGGHDIFNPQNDADRMTSEYQTEEDAKFVYQPLQILGIKRSKLGPYSPEFEVAVDDKAALQTHAQYFLNMVSSEKHPAGNFISRHPFGKVKGQNRINCCFPVTEDFDISYKDDSLHMAKGDKVQVTFSDRYFLQQIPHFICANRPDLALEIHYAPNSCIAVCRKVASKKHATISYHQAQFSGFVIPDDIIRQFNKTAGKG